MTEIKLHFYNELGLMQVYENGVIANLTNFGKKLADERIDQVRRVLGEDAVSKLLSGERITLDLEERVNQEGY